MRWYLLQRYKHKRVFSTYFYRITESITYILRIFGIYICFLYVSKCYVCVCNDIILCIVIKKNYRNQKPEGFENASHFPRLFFFITSFRSVGRTRLWQYARQRENKVILFYHHVTLVIWKDDDDAYINVLLPKNFHLKIFQLFLCNTLTMYILYTYIYFFHYYYLLTMLYFYQQILKYLNVRDNRYMSINLFF